MRVFPALIAFLLITVALYWGWVNATYCEVMFSCPTASPVKITVTQLSTGESFEVYCSGTLHEPVELKCGIYHALISGEFLETDHDFEFQIPYFGQHLKLNNLLDFTDLSASERGKLSLLGNSSDELQIAPVSDNTRGEAKKAKDGMLLATGDYSLIIPINKLTNSGLEKNVAAVLAKLPKEVALATSVQRGQTTNAQLLQETVFDKIERSKKELAALSAAEASASQAENDSSAIDQEEARLRLELSRLTEELSLVNGRRKKSDEKLAQSKKRYHYLSDLLAGDGVAHWQEWVRSSTWVRARGGEGHYNRGQTIAKSTIRDVVFGK